MRVEMKTYETSTRIKLQGFGSGMCCRSDTPNKYIPVGSITLSIEGLDDIGKWQKSASRDSYRVIRGRKIDRCTRVEWYGGGEEHRDEERE